MDKNNRKVIHYAAVCTSPEPLKLLLGRDGVNVLDIEHKKKNCLHFAAIAGRAQNVKLILDHKPQMITSKDS